MMLGIIPARGGSKGVPRKNIRMVAGYPLIYWTIQAARASNLLDGFYISTEDDEIAEIARSYGADVLDRPTRLAADETTTLEVLQHIVSEKPCDAVVVLQPTSPLRNRDTIDGCIDEYLKSGCDTLATGYQTKIVEYGTHQNLRRQDIPGFFYDDGNVYIIDGKVIESGRWYGDKICKKEIDPELRYEIDDETTLQIVESLLWKRIERNVQPSEFLDRLAGVRLLVMDMDGVLTDSGMYYSENGEVMKKFSARDGMGIERVRKMGVKTALVTSENTEIAAKRAQKLLIDHIVLGEKDKLRALREIAAKEQIPLRNTAYIGDDINDLDAMKNTGVPVAVSDALDVVKKTALYVTRHEGGDGALRELCDLIINSRMPNAGAD
jgi:YrbI family 3-deoxy-D-manno-octulosonate 8-phosphate phosphatase